MPSITIYVTKDIYRKIVKMDDSESKVVQKALESWFEKLGVE